LPVNLEFVQKTDIRHLHRIYVVFDRVRQAQADEFIGNVCLKFPRLPMSFSFHRPVTGWFVERINQSKFYASMNWILGLAQCETRFAVLHDFDLYPLVPNYFSSMIDAMRTRSLRFTGVEYTFFDGLDPSNSLIGTWALGVDVAWLREKFRPIDCFHTVENIAGRRFDLDAFTFIQSQTPERALVGVVTAKDMAHVRNLVSTFLRFSKGQRFDVVWRLHQMWYLDFLCGRSDRLDKLIGLMDNAVSAQLRVENLSADFSNTHVTCANVLREQVLPMEEFLFGHPRSEVLEYIRAFEYFLRRYGKSDTIYNPDGSVRWSAAYAKPELPATNG
jgi:hypothetical protein